MSVRRPRRPGGRVAHAPVSTGAAFTPLSLALTTYYRFDVTKYTLNGTDVSAWANQGSTGATDNMTNGSTGPQPAFTLSNATWNNRPTATYTADSLVAGTMSTTHRPLYDGTGGFMFIIFRSTSTTAAQIVWSCGGNSTTTAGIRFMYNGTTERLTIQASNDTAFMINSAATGATPINTKGILLFRFQNGRVGVDDWELYWNNVKIHGGDPSNTPATGVGPDVVPVFGATSSTGASNPFIGDIVEAGSGAFFPSDAQVTQLYTYAQARYGL